jgi:hypothetical protein
MTTHSKYIDALLFERAGYEKRGLTDRVRAIDAALREIGFDHKYLSTPVETATAVPQAETAALPKTRARKKG